MPRPPARTARITSWKEYRIGLQTMSTGSFRHVILALFTGRIRLVHRVLRGAILFEAGAAIIFFGSLIHRPDLTDCGARAIEELVARGYEAPSGASPVRVYPAEGAEAVPGRQAGNWRPGVISLRENPLGSLGPEIYLRHELMHEAGHRTCPGRFPLWAEEAAAMNFSGELQAQDFPAAPTANELERLAKRVRIAAPLDGSGYRTLAKLVSAYGWPREPCAISREIEALLAASKLPGEANFSYVLISLLSGRVFESGGNPRTKAPPGSLLKIPYAASLRNAQPDALGVELAASDTERLLNRRGDCDFDRFRFFASIARGSPPSGVQPLGESTARDDPDWRSCLGERGRDGTFALEADLFELALMLRAALLFEPDAFRGLARNGFMTGTTLYQEPEAEKRILARLRAMSKTGTASDERGNPLAGHLMVAWPAEAPVYMAVFRSLGSNGASNLKRASRFLDEWSTRHPVEYGRVRVELMTLVPRDSWEMYDECPGFERVTHEGWKQRVSTCGRFKILSSARGSRSERFISGIPESSPDGRKLVLETDPETYADAVLDSEAQNLRGEAKKALRAVVVWNGVHGGGRHPESSAVCDSTHCMVFRGSQSDADGGRTARTNGDLLRIIEDLAREKHLDWLPFSKGGAATWTRSVPSLDLNRLLDEPLILDVRRERSRRGDVLVHLLYKESEESISCEIFRGKLKLPSCPDSIHFDESRGAWQFEGVGEGHGLGLSVERARMLSEAGRNAKDILADAYGKSP